MKPNEAAVAKEKLRRGVRPLEAQLSEANPARRRRRAGQAKGPALSIAELVELKKQVDRARSPMPSLMPEGCGLPPFGVTERDIGQ